jgi:glycosyltransferase involved in cell wall biosynthesis
LAFQSSSETERTKREKMKLVMINDCANVGETLLKYMPRTIERQHIRRTRGLWSKTFGVAYEILRAKGDIYHSNYLLQDCYVAIRLGKKPIVGYALGSDLRTSLKHVLWGRVVRHNAKNCDKILVSTPDILAVAKQFRDDAEYLPPAVDTELFYPKPTIQHQGKKRVLIASNSNWDVKGTDIAIRALSKLKDDVEISIIQHGPDFEKTLSLASSLGLALNVLPKASHQQIREYYWNSDVVMDQFKFGCAGMISLESIACGRPALVYVTSEYQEYDDFPVKDLRSEEQIVEAITQADQGLWKNEYKYLEKNHRPVTVLERLLAIYDSLIRN